MVSPAIPRPPGHPLTTAHVVRRPAAEPQFCAVACTAPDGGAAPPPPAQRVLSFFFFFGGHGAPLVLVNLEHCREGI